MANIGTLLKQEIARLSRKQIRSEISSMRKASAQYRRDIAALKRQSAELMRKVSLLSGKVLAVRPAATGEAAAKPMRFVPKGLKSHRDRLGFSAAEYGRLVGVSAQSIYNWERGVASPRAAQLSVLGTLRGMGKREARARLDELGGKTDE